MADDHTHVTCTACGQVVRSDRIDAKGVCTNCGGSPPKPKPKKRSSKK